MDKRQFMTISLHSGLLVQCKIDFSNIGIFELSLIENKNESVKLINYPYCGKQMYYKTKYIKPILHPLSDYEKLGLDITDEITIQNIIDKRDIIGNMKLNLAQQLIEAHFDIAGLIEKGEAIDVNTFSINPYK